MTPGTSPAARSFRATPLPVSVRGFAASDTVAMFSSQFLKSLLLRRRTSRRGVYSQEAASSLPCASRRFLHSCRHLLLEERAHRLLGVREPHGLGQQVADR